MSNATAGSKVDRRGFLRGAGATIGAVSALQYSEARASEAIDSPVFDKQADVLIVGVGPGGLIAAARAAEQGVSVIAIDASTRSGGTMLVSNGFMSTHGSNSVEELSANAPMTDPVLGQAFLDAWDGFIAWNEKLGTPMSVFDRQTEHGTYAVYRFGNELPPAGTLEYADFVEEYAKGLGVEFIYQTTVKHLVMDESGSVIGAEAKKADGSTLTVGAKQVVLACGGIQRDREMAVRYVGPHADLVCLRGNPHDTGRGLKMAQEAGGALSRGFGTYYGHPVPYGIDLTMDCETWDANIGSAEWIAQAKEIYNVSQNAGEDYCVMLNMNGERFHDESEDYQLVNQTLARQKFARGFIVMDSAIRADHVSLSSEGTDVLEYLEKRGGTLLKGDTLDELADQIALQGVPRANVLRTIEEYNEAAKAGTSAELTIPKANADKAIPLEQGPFVALPVVVSYIFPYGGVKVDVQGRVLDIDDDPIPGLWATQGVAGGLQYDYFIGILCSIAGMAYATGEAVGKAAAGE